jgi:hypothetical protein
MGEVKGNDIVKKTEQCKCNEICAHAAGPCCSCMCLGVNHGLKKLAYVKIDKITGKVSHQIKINDKALSHAVWYRGVISQINDKSIWGALSEPSANRRNLPWNIFRSIRKVENLIYEFKKAKTHKKREQVYNEISKLTAPSIEINDNTPLMAQAI